MLYSDKTPVPHPGPGRLRNCLFSTSYRTLRSKDPQDVPSTSDPVPPPSKKCGVRRCHLNCPLWLKFKYVLVLTTRCSYTFYVRSTPSCLPVETLYETCNPKKSRRDKNQMGFVSLKNDPTSHLLFSSPYPPDSLFSAAPSMARLGRPGRQGTGACGLSGSEVGEDTERRIIYRHY